MKKLFGISLIAVFSVSPLMASAADTAPVAVAAAKSGLAANGANVVTATNGKYYAGETITDTDKAVTASAAYVKGAYNAAISAVNKVAETADAASAAAANAITGAGDGLTKDGSNLKAKAADGINVSSSGIAVKAGNGISVASTGVAVKAKSGGGITVDANGVSLTNGIKGAANTTTYKETGLTTQGYVDEKVAGATSGMVTASSSTTFTNKTIDATATGNKITNLQTSNFKSGTIVTSVGATGSDTALPTEQAVREAITSATSNAATKEGVSASIDKATAKGNIKASVTGTVGGTLTSGTSDLKIGGGTITNTVTQGSVTVPYATAWSGTAPVMVNWGDTQPTDLNNVTIASTATNGVATKVSGTGVKSTLANATVTSGSITHTLTGLTVSGSATQNNVTFDVASTGYVDNASDTTPEYVPTAG